MKLLILLPFLISCTDDKYYPKCEPSQEGIVSVYSDCIKQCTRYESADGIYYKWVCWRPW